MRLTRIISSTALLQALTLLASAVADEDPHCGLYLAESTIPGAGLGIFAGEDFKEGSKIGRGDVCIPFVEMYWHNEPDFYPNPFKDYFWSGESMGMTTESDTDDVEAYCPGLDCAVNCHQGLLNVGKSTPEYDEAGLHRAVDPGAGAITPYHNGSSIVLRDIPAGGELFKDYGPNWFVHRYHIFGEIPLSDNYDEARDLLVAFREIKSPSQKVTDDLYELMRGLSSKKIFDSRTLNALPVKLDDALFATQEEKDIGHLVQINSSRPLSFLKETGKCIDHIIAGPSSIKQAGRGAFAARTLPKGTVITASPLHHVPDKRFAEMYNFTFADGRHIRAMDQVKGYQIMLNYCYSHPETTLLFCPYGASVNYINHDRERANVKIQWAKNFPLGHNQTVVDTGDFSFLEKKETPVLALDYIATETIREGEELFLDYGDPWVEAWENHLLKWKPVPKAEHYGSAHYWATYFNETIIRTDDEQTYDPYPDHLEIRCHAGLMNGQNIVDFRWSIIDQGLPCSIVSRHVENGQFFYTVDLQWEPEDGGNVYVVRRAGIPRQSITFFDVPKTTDLHLPNVFRFPATIPDDMLPEGWRNVEEDDVDDESYQFFKLYTNKGEETFTPNVVLNEDHDSDDDEDDDDVLHDEL